MKFTRPQVIIIFIIILAVVFLVVQNQKTDTERALDSLDDTLDKAGDKISGALE